MFKIASWNVNSVRKRVTQISDWLSKSKVDVVLLQETRVEDALFPVTEFAEVGYFVLMNGQKARNGVAVLSRYPFIETSVKTSFGSDFNDARYIEVDIKVNSLIISVASVYVPNGQEVGSEAFNYKLLFFDELHNYLMQNKKKVDSIFMIGGDFNVAPEDIDVYSPRDLEGTVCFHIEERKRFRKIVNYGFADLFRAFNHNVQEFSWWNYRGFGFQKNYGMRLDHLLGTPRFSSAIDEVSVLKSFRAQEAPSDHAPVQCSLNLDRLTGF